MNVGTATLVLLYIARIVRPNLYFSRLSPDGEYYRSLGIADRTILDRLDLDLAYFWLRAPVNLLSVLFYRTFSPDFGYELLRYIAVLTVVLFLYRCFRTLTAASRGVTLSFAVSISLAPHVLAPVLTDYVTFLGFPICVATVAVVSKSLGLCDRWNDALLGILLGLAFFTHGQLFLTVLTMSLIYGGIEVFERRKETGQRRVWIARTLLGALALAITMSGMEILNQLVFGVEGTTRRLIEWSTSVESIAGSPWIAHSPSLDWLTYKPTLLLPILGFVIGCTGELRRHVESARSNQVPKQFEAGTRVFFIHSALMALLVFGQFNMSFGGGVMLEMDEYYSVIWPTTAILLFRPILNGLSVFDHYLIKPLVASLVLSIPILLKSDSLRSWLTDRFESSDSVGSLLLLIGAATLLTDRQSARSAKRKFRFVRMIALLALFCSWFVIGVAQNVDNIVAISQRTPGRVSAAAIRDDNYSKVFDRTTAVEARAVFNRSSQVFSRVLSILPRGGELAVSSHPGLSDTIDSIAALLFSNVRGVGVPPSGTDEVGESAVLELVQRRHSAYVIIDPLEGRPRAQIESLRKYGFRVREIECFTDRQAKDAISVCAAFVAPTESSRQGR